MAPLPPIPKGLLPAGQMTIISASNGALGVARPPTVPHSGPKPKESNRAKTVLGCRLTSGLNEQRALQVFATFQLSVQDGGELGDEETARMVIRKDVEDEDMQAEEDDDDDYTPCC